VEQDFDEKPTHAGTPSESMRLFRVNEKGIAEVYVVSICSPSKDRYDDSFCRVDLPR
jgi:hypothetical protein